MKKILAVICVIILIWFIASIVDVDMHNLTTQRYASWNIFSALLRRA
jgi:hypothetical protein